MDKKYKKVLSDLMPSLKTYPYKRGSEGMAYFIDNDFVIKYFEMVDLPYRAFDNYCNEIQRFGDAGLACPKVYSWARVPIFEDDGKAHRYYILEEQVQGEGLYPYDIEDLYPKMNLSMSKGEFLGKIKKIKDNQELYIELLNEYSKTILERSGQLEALSTDEIRRFIESYIQINKNSIFSVPDLHVGNVLFDGEKLTLIDNTMIQENLLKWRDKNGNFKERSFQWQTLSELLYLFSCVRHYQYAMTHYERETGEKLDNKFNLADLKNRKIFGSFMQKWAKECKNLLVYDHLGEAEIESIIWSIKTIVDSKSEKNIITEFSK